MRISCGWVWDGEICCQVDHVVKLFFPLPQTQKPRLSGRGFCLLLGSLTITYFHTGIRTIIGVESFHGP
ncbi:hypothetical protein P3T18_004440, partial [Paraburkholderia sp. GAS199]